MNESTTPTTKRSPKNTPPKKGRGGHASEREKVAPLRKEPENYPDSIRFKQKGALMHTRNSPQIPTRRNGAGRGI